MGISWSRAETGPRPYRRKGRQSVPGSSDHRESHAPKGNSSLPQTLLHGMDQAPLWDTWRSAGWSHLAFPGAGPQVQPRWRGTHSSRPHSPPPSWVTSLHEQPQFLLPNRHGGSPFLPCGLPSVQHPQPLPHIVKYSLPPHTKIKITIKR